MRSFLGLYLILVIQLGLRCLCLCKQILVEIICTTYTMFKIAKNIDYEGIINDKNSLKI